MDCARGIPLLYRASRWKDAIKPPDVLPSLPDIGIGSSTIDRGPSAFDIDPARWSELGRNNILFETVRGFAMSVGKSVTLEECMKFASKSNVGGLPSSEVRSVSRSVYNFMQKKYRGKRMSDRERLDRAVFAVNARWHYFNRTVGETLAEAATRFEVSYATIKRWKVSGKIEWIDKEWRKTSQEPYEPVEFEPVNFPPRMRNPCPEAGVKSMGAMENAVNDIKKDDNSKKDIQEEFMELIESPWKSKRVIQYASSS